MLPSLSFVPEEKVQEALTILINTIPEETQSVFDYFERTYIGRTDRNKPPTFPIKVWNCYNAVKNDLPRTNNNVEGWHRAFSSSIGSQPNVWKFIQQIESENCNSMLILNQVL